jgi:hypothetical protein
VADGDGVAGGDGALSGSTFGSLADVCAGFRGLKILGGTLSGSTTAGWPGPGGTPGIGGGTVFNAGGTGTWGRVGSGIGRGFSTGSKGSGITKLTAAAGGATVASPITGADHAVARKSDRLDTPLPAALTASFPSPTKDRIIRRDEGRNQFGENHTRCKTCVTGTWIP